MDTKAKRILELKESTEKPVELNKKVEEEKTNVDKQIKLENKKVDILLQKLNEFFKE